MKIGELTEFLGRLDPDQDIYITCAYNRYKISRMIIHDDHVTLDTGTIDDIDNPEDPYDHFYD